MKSKTFRYDKINSFDLSVKYAELSQTSPENVHTHHVHNACEIYVNVTGNVSFMVEDRIYPISPGSVVITRPYEYHHCIYNDDSLHKHFWILFTVEGNENIFDVFFRRKKGENSLLQFRDESKRKLFNICDKLLSEKTSDFENYYYFFELINMLANHNSEPYTNIIYHASLNNAIEYINQHFSSSITVEDIAKASFVSINTLERQFKAHLHISPSEFVRQKRLSNAAALLHEGSSVQYAAEKSGFTDYSNFIVLFKKYYGKTPLKYKKETKNLC